MSILILTILLWCVLITPAQFVEPLHIDNERDLLICIAFHYQEDRLKYIQTVLQRFLDTYHVDLTIIIDTNSTETIKKLDPVDPRVHIKVHEMLAHPFHLTWTHRAHMKKNIKKFTPSDI